MKTFGQLLAGDRFRFVSPEQVAGDEAMKLSNTKAMYFQTGEHISGVDEDAPVVTNE